MEPGPGFEYGEQVTIVITAVAVAGYGLWRGGREMPALALRMPSGAAVDIACKPSAVRVIRGDITPALAQVFADAMRLRECPEDECTFLWQQHDALREALGVEPRPVLTAAPQPADPG